MKKLIKSISFLLLLAGLVFSLEACSRDDNGSEGNGATSLNDFSGKLEHTEEGIHVKITRVQPSGSDFLEVFYDAVIVENPKREISRDVWVSIEDNLGRVYSQNGTITENAYKAGNIYSGRILMRVNDISQLRKNTLKIVKVEVR